MHHISPAGGVPWNETVTSNQQIEQMLTQKHVRGLCRALRHRNTVTRRRAAQALGELRDPQGVPCLARAVREDVDQYVRRWAILSLQKIGDETAIDALTEAMFGTRLPTARLAAQALAGIPSAQARATLQLRDILLRNDWDALEGLGAEIQRPLGVFLRSEQFAAWPSTRRKQLFAVAVKIGVSLPSEHAGELAQMGIYLSGVHTIGDLLNGLRHSNPEVRIAAAERLADTGQGWVAMLLYRRFRREIGPGGDLKVAAALARALDRLGEPGAINYYQERLYTAEGRFAAEAARMLADIGTPRSLEALFWFAATPPPPPAYRNVPLALNALATAGPIAVDTLRPLLVHESVAVRRRMVDVVAGSKHPETVSLLTALCYDVDEDIRRSALDALAATNSAEAAGAIFELARDLPQAWIARALAVITDPMGPYYLRQLVPDATVLTGTLRHDNRLPVAHASVQIVQMRFFGEQAGWGWQAVSARAQTDDTGAFMLSLVGNREEGQLRLKVVLPSHQHGQQSESYTADIAPAFGRMNYVQARLDHFFNRLIVQVSQEAGEDEA